MADKFADNTFKCIFLNESIRILIDISLKFVPKSQINNIPNIGWDNVLAPTRWQALSEPEPMMVSLLMHIYVTRPQWVKLTKDTPYRTHMCKLWDICCVCLGENWPYF